MADVRERIHALDGLRGILAVFVCLYHLTNTFPGAVEVISAYLPLLRNGWIAVDVFFVLSGFVLAYVYGQSFRRGIDRDNLRDFFVARVARLYPVHLATLGVLVVVLVPFIFWRDVFQNPDGRYSWQSLLPNILMLQGPWVDHRTWNYPSWSISAEFHAYALFPVLIVMITGTWRSVAALVVGIGLPLALYLSQPFSERFPTNGAGVLLRSLPLFAAGIGLYNLRDDLFAVPKWAIAVPVVLLPVLLSFEALAPFAVLSVLPLVIGSLCLAPLRSVLQTRPAVWLGEISYSLYLIHALVQIIVLERLQDRFHPGPMVSLALVAAGIACSVVAAVLLRRFVELPGRVFVRKLFAPRAAVTPAE